MQDGMCTGMSGGERETDHTTIKCQRPELGDFIVSNTNHPVQAQRNSFWLCDELGGLHS